jgi:hypothetical protein
VAVKLPLSGKWVERGDFTDAELDAIDREYLRGKGLVPPSDPTQGPPQGIQGPPAPQFGTGTIGEQGVEAFNQLTSSIPFVGGGIPELTPEGARMVIEGTGGALGAAAALPLALAAPPVSPLTLGVAEAAGEAGGSLLSEALGLGETDPQLVETPFGELDLGPTQRALEAGAFAGGAAGIGNVSTNAPRISVRSSASPWTWRH